MKTYTCSSLRRYLKGVLVAGLVTGTTLICSGRDVSSASESGISIRYSAGIADILKMVDAKVDAEVIKAYVKSSPILYNPNAAEIIALKDHGVSSDVLVALLQR